MSANLLDGIKPRLAYGSMADGVITSSTPKDSWTDVAFWPITTGKLASNQTMHLGISAKWHGTASTTGSARVSVKYADAAGNTNNVDIAISGISTEWKRFSLSAVIPSGMHIVDFHISSDNLNAAYDATNPVLSYGSPLVLAIASSTLAWSAGIVATTRYYQLAAPTAATPTVPTSSSDLGSWSETEPTADITKVLWTCERTIYADGTESWSKASKSTSYEAAKDAKSIATDAKKTATENSSSISKLSDQISSEVKTRTKTDTTVSEISSRLTQTADALHLSINRLSETDNNVNSWFDFDSDSSGKPQLKMGSSTSPVVGIYTNTGLAYKSQAGDTLMELDASRSATVADHMEAQDVKIGKWKWIQTQDGSHLTLVWAG